MGPLRTMKVFILGDVVKPGTYTVSSLATMTNALFAAGGPSKQGSLRDVRLIRGNRIVARMDLYKFLLEGNREGDERLLPDDTIFVPPIGPVVALAGYVKRPAIYELKGDTTLAQLLEMAGGLTIVSYIKRVQVERVLERQRKVALDTEFTDLKDFEAKTTSFALHEGDFVSVFPIDRALYRFVQLEGNVRRPGTYALKPGMRVKDLIDEAEGLLPGTYMVRADLAKFCDGRQYEMVPLDLTAAMAGDAAHNVPLDEFDRVIVYHQWDVLPIPTVQVTGAVYRPGVFELTPNMRVSDLVFKGQPTRQASYENAEMYRAIPGEPCGSSRWTWPGSRRIREARRTCAHGPRPLLYPDAGRGGGQTDGDHRGPRALSGRVRDRARGTAEQPGRARGGLAARGLPEGGGVHPRIDPRAGAAATRAVHPDAGAEPDRRVGGDHRGRQRPVSEGKPGRWRPRRRSRRSGESS